MVAGGGVGTAASLGMAAATQRAARFVPAFARAIMARYEGEMRPLRAAAAEQRRQKQAAGGKRREGPLPPAGV